jgi:hypothetical protein
MMSIFVRIFYFLTFLICSFHLPRMLSKNFTHASLVGFAYFLNFLPWLAFACHLVALLACFVALGASLKPNRFFRIAVALLFSIFVFTSFFGGKINHSQTLWMMAAYLFIFVDLKKGIYDFPNSYIRELLEVIILTTYLIAVLWKVRNLGLATEWSELRAIVLNNVAISIGQGSGPRSFFKVLFEQYPNFYVFGFLGAVMFQLTTALPIFIKKYRYAWGWGALFFHLMTGLGLGVWFIEQGLLVAYVLIFIPTLLKSESRDLSDDKV